MASATPRLRVEAACETLGRTEFVRRCVDLLAGGSAEPDFLITLGGRPAFRLLATGAGPADGSADGPVDSQAYWLRVWATRGLLWSGIGEADAGAADAAVDALSAALADESWRVREMACKVAARHRVDDLIEQVVELEADPVERVRIAASRATRTMLAAAD